MNYNKKTGSKNFVIIVGIFTIFGVLINFLQCIKPKETNNDIRQNVNMNVTSQNVTSHNPQGGITAGEVNIGSLPRVFTKEYADKLDSAISELNANKNQKISITSTLGDPESYNFAEQIGKYLESKGWSIVSY
ncbi:MAG: hypothetical protein PHG69_05065, partial [Candidatus Omnitrophica bacterium]|nr:hypothetical protein [Candidatus Omnitrophota bacterium]